MLRILKRFSNYFLIGIFAILPIAIVIQIVLVVESLIRRLFHSVYGYTSDNLWITFVALALSVLTVTLIGYQVKKGKSYIVNWFEYVINRVPILSTLYRVIKKVLDQFNRKQEEESKEIVYIEYPKDGLWVPGYITNRQGEMYVIYVPTSPNPTSGFTIIVHQSKIVHSEMDIEDVTSFIASVGVDFNKGEEAKHLLPGRRI